ncbi:MAG: PAS domain S-box protein [Flavobacterium sp.]|nr:MAG: PAS domain S-box protein [Flavobacterium sp.]
MDIDNEIPARDLENNIAFTKNEVPAGTISETQSRLAELIDTVDGIVWESDYETFCFTFVNKKAEAISGYAPHEWLGDPNFWASTIHPDDRDWAIAYCEEKSRSVPRYDFEYRMIAKDGRIIWIRDIVNAIVQDGKIVSLRGIMIDITKAKEAEQDLSRSFDLVTEQNKRLQNFSYIVSHNLRSHIANIQSIANLIETAENQEERDEMISMLKKVSRSLDDTMINLNELLTIKSDPNMVTETIDLHAYIKNTLEVLRDELARKQISVFDNVPDGILIEYNPAYLESILLNLLTNAIRYSNPDKNREISISWNTLGNGGELSVSDNGIGIDLALHGDKIFGMYKTFHGNPDARGIGLFITRNQAEAMGGSISVESAPGIGSTFRISFK